MKKHVSRWCARLLALVMVMSLAACGSGDTQQTIPQADNGDNVAATSGNAEAGGEEKEWYGNPDGTPVTLKFYAAIQPEYGYAEMVNNFNAEFADKGIQLEYVRYVNNADGNMEIDTYLTAGGTIDVLVTYTATNYLLNRYQSGLLYNMTDLLQEYGFDVDKEMGSIAMGSYYMEGDQVYGIPSTFSNNRWMLVNVDMFEAAGVEVPYDGWTYEEFLTACEKLTKGEGAEKTYGMMWCWNTNSSMALQLISAPLGQFGTYASADGSAPNFDAPVWNDGLTMMKTSMDEGWAYSAEQEIADSLTFQNTFLAGKCAISMNVSQLRLVLDTATYPHDFKTAMVPGPVPDESYLTDEYRYNNGATLVASDLMTVAADTKHPEACVQFVLWYLRGGMTPVATYGRIPLWSGYDYGTITDALAASGDILDLVSMMTFMSVDKNSFVSALSFDTDSKIDTALKEEITAVLLGKQSVEEGLANAKTRGDGFINSN